MPEPAVYLVAARYGKRAPWESYFSEAVEVQIFQAEFAAGLFASVPSGFKPDLDAYPRRSVPPGDDWPGIVSLRWWPLLANPIHLDEWNDGTRWFGGFTAAARGSRCLLEWRSSSRPSPFPGGASQVELVHGARFGHPHGEYIVWVEPAEVWSDDEVATPSDAEILRELSTLGTVALEHGSKRFLALPRISRWWGEEFMRLAGFVPFRPDLVPHAVWCGISAVEGGFVLRWTVVMEGREVLGFFRELSGADLVALRDCATFLHGFSVMPELARYQTPLPPVQEIEAELAFLQVERDRLDDPVRRNQLRHRMRDLDGMLYHARNRADSEAAEAVRLEAVGSVQPPLTPWERVRRGPLYDPIALAWDGQDYPGQSHRDPSL